MQNHSKGGHPSLVVTHLHVPSLRYKMRIHGGEISSHKQEFFNKHLLYGKSIFFPSHNPPLACCAFPLYPIQTLLCHRVRNILPPPCHIHQTRASTLWAHPIVTMGNYAAPWRREGAELWTPPTKEMFPEHITVGRCNPQWTWGPAVPYLWPNEEGTLHLLSPCLNL